MVDDVQLATDFDGFHLVVCRPGYVVIQRGFNTVKSPASHHVLDRFIVFEQARPAVFFSTITQFTARLAFAGHYPS